jgi:2-polyprenyl-3-methyl-5-hydroxy-6-metoxy-1,4-benzoquinol methylase
VTINVELEDTGERMVPEFHKGRLLYAEHFLRYLAIRNLVTGKVVLDIASGSGYGTALLAESATKVFGFDASADAVRYAADHFGAENIEFRVADASQIPLPDNSVDVVVTFETIEHIENYRAFASELARVLKHDGVAVVSTPNDLEFVEGNHFHLHQFEEEELLTLLGEHFPHIIKHYQATWKYVAIGTLESMSDADYLPGRTLNLSPLQKDECLYFYFLCSAEEMVSVVDPIAAVGEHYSDRALLRVHADSVARIQALDSAIALSKARVLELENEAREFRESKAYRLVKRAGDIRARLRRK